MKRKTQYSSLAAMLVYGVAALTLFLFLQKNHESFSLHLQDVKNSAGPPLAVGASVPSFTLEKLNGQLINSSELPEKYTIILSSADCPYVKEALEFLEQEGQYHGVSALYAVYVALRAGEAESIYELGANWKNVIPTFDFENSVKWGFRCNGYPTLITIEHGKIISRQVGWQGETAEIA